MSTSVVLSTGKYCCSGVSYAERPHAAYDGHDLDGGLASSANMSILRRSVGRRWQSISVAIQQIVFIVGGVLLRRAGDARHFRRYDSVHRGMDPFLFYFEGDVHAMVGRWNR